MDTRASDLDALEQLPSRLQALAKTRPRVMIAACLAGSATLCGDGAADPQRLPGPAGAQRAVTFRQTKKKPGTPTFFRVAGSREVELGAPTRD